MNINNRLYKAILKGLNEALTRFDLDEFDFNDEVKPNNIRLDKFKASKLANQKNVSAESNYQLKQILDNEDISKSNIDKIDKLFAQGATYKASNDTLKQLVEKYIELKGNECNLNWIDTSDVTDMSAIFEASKFNGDISKWNTSKVTDMHSMFEHSEFNGDISNWNVYNVTDMSFMFFNSKFNSDISKWDVHNVTNMFGMFEKSKFNGDISKWNTSNVTDMSSMFKKSEFNGDISKWNTSNVTDMNSMFDGCKIPKENKPKFK